ncbi:hypothetical protein HLB44_09770 [Aquincola sp. S2]|uniref:Calpain catalytic domain-containing protein n=1 Tax=Pseudaquabacterium terrae TaxID=2732868 RepID=A0ABX2EF99_9BURK|nr:C2 family cysteine protease [Aquabacterium terrae]NRF67270.1 hypothetical protein [Aquabacterium terrae]
MPTTKVEVLEPHARHIGSAMLVITADSSWAVGTTMANAVKVSLPGVPSIDDSTFGYSAVAVEKDGAGYKLFVRNDEDEDQVLEVRLDSTGRADAATLALLQGASLYAAEEQYKVDLNDSGGFGQGDVLLQGGAANLYVNELGHYRIGVDSASATLMVGAAPLDDQLLPAGWEIVEAVPTAGGGWRVFAQDPQGNVFDASFDAGGAFSGGSVLGGAALDAVEAGLGLDIDGDNDLAAPAGWTSVIQTPSLRTAIDQALAPPPGQLAAPGANAAVILADAPNTMTHAELVALLRGVVTSHQANGNAPITAQEVADLQALAARGAAAFAGNGAAADYLSYVFARLVEGSDANRFYQGGNAQRSELGSLAAGASPELLDKLIQKWLLGGDLPGASTAGDSATGAAKSVVAAYAKSSGALFVDGIAVSDVNQGTAGDCYLIAAMGGLAVTKPTALQELFVENTAVGDVRTWGVRFFDANGKAHWVTVNDMLPVPEAGGTTLAYAGSANKALNGEIWVPLLEKAYAQANTLGILPRAESTGFNTYAAIEGGQGDPLGALVQSKVIAVSNPGTSFGNNGYLVTVPMDRTNPEVRAQLEAAMASVINAGKVVWLGVNDTVKDGFDNQLLVGSHAHFIVDADPNNPNNTDVLVYNPWGLSTLPTPPGPAPGNFVSPATYTIAQLVGIAGLDFMVLEGG